MRRSKATEGLRKKAVRKDWIERVVVRLTMQRVMDEEKINRLIDAILVIQEQEVKTPLQSERLGVGHSGVFLISPVFSMLLRLAWRKAS